MKLLAFRIKHFRSILDSGWVSFSPDGITAIVGQNESGKSSVLDALYFALHNDPISEDDMRVPGPRPVVQLSVELNMEDVKPGLEKYDASDITRIAKYFNLIENKIEIDCIWDVEKKNGITEIDPGVALSKNYFDKYQKLSAVTAKSDNEKKPYQLTTIGTEAVTGEVVEVPSQSKMDPDDLASLIWKYLPRGVRFDDASGRLPSTVSIDNDGRPTGDGAQAANNFLTVADIDLKALLQSDLREQKSIITRANNAISKDFNQFWSQTIGKDGRLSFVCELENYGKHHGERAGSPHLVFWVCDGQNRLYPKQRSQGVSWFISFYLQLKASEKKGINRVFFLDEPGSNLHAKAQADVLKLINHLRKHTSTVVYSTHSPQMIEYEKLYRVHAVQRDDDNEDSPSKIISAHQLGTASSDTLSPILAAMGVDLSNQNVVRRSNNVILEEMSGYYYLTSFWRLVNEESEVHFIAATGADKVVSMVNMFLGWGLNFIVVLDDDKKGREVIHRLKKTVYGDRDDEAQKQLFRLRGCAGIEDALSQNDFSRFVLKRELNYEESNSEHMKKSDLSKPVAAFQFANAVRDKLITFEMLDAESQEKIRGIVALIRDNLR